VQANFPIKMDGYDNCYYVKEDDRDSGQVECIIDGQTVLAFRFARDPGYDEPFESCDDGKGHRGYYLEVFFFLVLYAHILRTIASSLTSDVLARVLEMVDDAE
jgi:hypothetical protein